MKSSAAFLFLSLAFVSSPSAAADDIVRMVCRDYNATCNDFQERVRNGAHQQGQPITYHSERTGKSESLNCGWRYVEIDPANKVRQWEVGPYVYDAIAYSAEPLAATVSRCNNCTKTLEASSNAVECSKCCTDPGGCHGPDWAGEAILSYQDTGEWRGSMVVTKVRGSRQEKQDILSSAKGQGALGRNNGAGWICEAGEAFHKRFKDDIKDCLDSGVVYKAVTTGRSLGAKEPGSLIKGIPDLEIIDCKAGGKYVARRRNTCGEQYAVGLGTVVHGKTLVYEWSYKNMQCGRPVLSDKLGDAVIRGESRIPIAKVKDAARKTGAYYVVGSNACFTHCYTGYKQGTDAQYKDFSGGEIDMSWDGEKKRYCNEQCFDPGAATKKTSQLEKK